MSEILLTSSVLIAALLALRFLFRNTLSRRVQYALWGLVLVRLLVPVSLPGTGLSVLTAAEPVAQQIGTPVLYIDPSSEVVTAPPDVPLLTKTPAPYRQVVLGTAAPDNTLSYTDKHQVTHEVTYTQQIPLYDLLRPIWLAGAAAAGLWFLACNLRFWQKLRKARIPYRADTCGYPVYLVESGLPSPCLFGLFRPSIYLTPEAVSSPERTRYVLAHEETHARHLDFLWGLLRGVCLAVYWFDPLVWAAAAVSKTDCELACDEAVLARLTPGERIAYGQTLLSLIPVRRTPAAPMLSATTMTSDKRRLKERITRIAENRQTRAAALFLALALTAGLCAATFTGARTEEVRPGRWGLLVKTDRRSVPPTSCRYPTWTPCCWKTPA